MIPLKIVTPQNIITSVQEHIIYWCGISETITTDQGTMFMSEEFEEFAASMGIKLPNFPPYDAQANGQAEASNIGVIKLIKRKIDKQLKRWHTTLN